MAEDQSITELIELTDPVRTDLLVTVDDPGGSPVTKGLPIETLLEAILTANGGIIYRDDSGDIVELTLSAANQVLVSDGTNPVYGTLAAILKAALLTSDGDILFRSNSGNVVALNKGNAKQLLRMNAAGTEPEYTDRTRYVQIPVVAFTSECETGDGQWYLHIPPELNGLDLVYVHAEVITAGTTNTLDIQVRNVTDSVDMLSTELTVDSGETGSDEAATPAVIDTAKDDVATNDVLAIDIDAVHDTPAEGLIVTLGFN